MGQLSELSVTETVRVDGDRLVELWVRMGQDRAEEVITLSVDNLWRGLAALTHARENGRFDLMAEQAKGMSQIADNLGLWLFAKVARDVEACARREDGPALASCLNRLQRVSDQSISTVWDLCDMTS
ncbi:MAG: hypothetical protein OXC60_18235 [Litoreibacter sp.]|nr:hypothetical protein [Litoreibacter sp.]MCY4336599.1 hypothetical protein [Litoreibacter sp.]